MKRIVIAGGTGFIGSSLARHLVAQGYEVVALGRSVKPDGGNLRHAEWDGRTTGDWCSWLDGADAVVNLAGRSVDCIKTPDHCDEILRSRVDATRAIGAALAQTENRPQVWVQMSTAHIYGDPGEQRITEGDAFGYGLAPTVGTGPGRPRWPTRSRRGCAKSVCGRVSSWVAAAARWPA
jgi:NAD dependent epimerase/dehydratase family enzyme